MKEYFHFIRLIRRELYGALFGVFISFLASFSSIALMTTATWLLSAMAVAGFYDYALGVFIPSALIRLLAVCRTILRYGERYYTHEATFKILAYLRVFLFERALDLRLEEALRLRSSDLQRRLQGDLERLELMYIRQFVPFIVAVLMGLIVGGVLISVSVLMAFTALFLMILAGVIIPLVMTKLSKKESTQLSTIAVELNDQMNAFIHGFFDLTLLRMQQQQAVAFLKKAQILAQARARIIFYDQLAQVFLMAIAELSLVLILIEGVPYVLSSDISSAQLMLFGVGTLATFEVIVPLSAAFLNIGHVKNSAKRVSDLLHITHDNADVNPHINQVLQEDDDTTLKILSKELEQGASAAASHAAGRNSVMFQKLHAVDNTTSSKAQEQQEGKVSCDNKNGICTVELDNVTFKYTVDKRTELNILQDCSLTFTSNHNYVIKAPSGRGKSTLVMLLTSLLYPISGELKLNGVPYRDLAGSLIRSHFAVAMQDISLFSGSFFDVFRQVRPKVTRDEVMQVLEIVELTDLIKELPNGLDEWFGSTGLAISGGQARRLCLARALIMSESDFLVLDEPGEGLDEEQEVRIIERIQNMRKGVIIITHKSAGLRLADEIINL